MSTNFYVKEQTCCPTCGKPSDVHHIGKSSLGWRFVFRGYEEHGLVSRNAWIAHLAGRTIVDEYGKEWSLAEFISLIKSKQDGRVNYDHRKKIDKHGYPIAYYEFS
jgi:hypothetical protein